MTARAGFDATSLARPIMVIAALLLACTAASAQQRLDAAVNARKFAEDQYSSEQRQFQAGTSTVFLVLQRQTDLTVARTREVRAESDMGEASANLDRALARTLEAHDIHLAQ